MDNNLLFKQSKTQRIIDNVFNWLKDNKDQTMIMSAVFIFIIVLIPFLMNYYKNAKQTLWESYSQAQGMYYNRNYEGAIQKADEILSGSRNSVPAKLALFTKANALYDSGKFADSETAFTEFKNKYKSDYLMPMVINSIACSQEMQGKFKEAIDNFTFIINQYTDSHILADSYMGKARCYELLGDKNNAKDVYQLIINMFPNTYWKSIAEERLAYLIANIPIPQQNKK
jgi:TolA-binding protein